MSNIIYRDGKFICKICGSTDIGISGGGNMMEVYCKKCVVPKCRLNRDGR